MLLGVVNGEAKTYEDFIAFNNATWSPEKEYSFVTDFSVKGKTYAARKTAARELAKSVQVACSNGSFSWSEMAGIGATMEKIARRYGLVREFKENGII